MKKRTIKQARARASRAFSLFIRLRDSIGGGMCECVTCGAVYPVTGSGKMQAGHFIPQRACPQLVFDERNCHAQCSRCNGPGKGEQYAMGVYIDKYTIYDSSEIFEDYLEHRNSRKKHRWTIKMLDEIADYYESILKRNFSQ